MATVTVNGSAVEVANWPEAVYGEPTIVRAGTLIYFVSTGITPVWARITTGGAFGTGYLNVLDGGYEITRGPDYASTADLLATAPEPGTVRWCFDGATYIRLGSEPAFDLRVGGLTGYVDEDGRHFDSTSLLAEAGLSVDVVGSIYITQRYIDDPSTTYLDVLNDSATGRLQSFGFNRLGEFQVSDIAAPTGDPVYAFTLENVIDVARSLPDGVPHPMWRLIVKNGETWPVSQLASGADESIKTSLKQSGYMHTFVREVPATRLKHLDAGEVVVECLDRVVINPSSFALTSDRWFELFGVQREQLTVTVVFDGNVLEIDCNDVVEVRMPRFGLSGGKLFRVIAVRYDLARKRAEFSLWG